MRISIKIFDTDIESYALKACIDKFSKLLTPEYESMFRPVVIDFSKSHLNTT